jgi:hypothetical protein
MSHLIHGKPHTEEALSGLYRGLKAQATQWIGGPTNEAQFLRRIVRELGGVAFPLGFAR